MENSFHYLGESLNSCDAISTKCKSKHGRTPKYDRQNQLLQGQALEQLVENTRQREFDKLFDSIQVYDGRTLRNLSLD